MAKIVALNPEFVEIGEDNGALTQVRYSDLNFTPRIGDTVDIFRSENSLRVVLSEHTRTNNDISQAGSGININLTQAQNQVAQPTPVQGYVEAGKVVNKLAYCLCAILVGGLGVHKFIAGKVGVGIVYILFCWTLIPSIIGLIEGIVGLTKTADAYGNIVV